MYEPDKSLRRKPPIADHRRAALGTQQRRYTIDQIAHDLDRIGGRLERIAADLQRCRRYPD
jgi:hypothetical protein